jgi:hypothetical protein
VQQFDLLWRQLAEQKGYPRDVVTRSRKARDNAKFDRIAAHRENHRNCVRHNRPGIDDRAGAASRYEDTHAMPNQICRQHRQTIDLSFRKTRFDGDVLPVDIALLL